MIFHRFGPLVVAFLAVLSGAQDQHPNRFSESNQTFKTLASFDGSDGAIPYASLTEWADGNFYGTTYNGGTGQYCNFRGGCGVVFEITGGKLTTLYDFCAQPNCVDGANPSGGVVLGIDGNFYGTTYQGGAHGFGSVFRVTPGGELKTLYSFCAQGQYCTDGSSPIAGLLQSTDGNFYGTTQTGGANYGGTVFKMTPQGKLTTLYSFCAQAHCSDGTEPMGVLVQATDGNFYGTTSNGGANANCFDITCGTVFRITPTGKLTTLYSFCAQKSCADGANPWAGVVQARDGNFYGTTSLGGSANQGTVFKISRAGNVERLYSFCTQGNCADGYEPIAALIQATDGNLYGTTYGGGSSGLGTVFRITARGELTTLHAFDSIDGSSLHGSLVQGANGTLYGTTGGGGAGGDGTVFGIGEAP